MRPNAETTPWLACPRRVAGAGVRLVCIPYAGGGGSAFSRWAAEIDDEVELWVAQLPGRERRFSEPLCTSVDQIAPALADAVMAQIPAPFALFGHSMGALIGFETARALRRRGGEPAHLFVSATTAPGSASPSNAHPVSDADLPEWMASLGGVPAEVLADPELLELVLRVLRADLRLCETYQLSEEPPLSCPITALAGVDDPMATPTAMAAWERHTAARFTLVPLPGGHFFLNDERPSVLAVVARQLRADQTDPATLSGAVR